MLAFDPVCAGLMAGHEGTQAWQSVPALDCSVRLRLHQTDAVANTQCFLFIFSETPPAPRGPAAFTSDFSGA